MLSIQSAFFGRNDSTTCVAEGVALRLTSAAWSNTNCAFAGALGVAQGWCNNKTSCALNESIWGADPCYGTYKVSRVFYTCAGTGGPPPEMPGWLRSASCVAIVVCCLWANCIFVRCAILGTKFSISGVNYWMPNSMATAVVAADTCRGQGGVLASINSAALGLGIHNAIKELVGPQPW